MRKEYCPLCGTELEEIDVAPCADCGRSPIEIEHALSGRHTYADMRVFGDLSLVLCDFCQVDFGSYDPTFFGLPPGTRIGFDRIEQVKVCDVHIAKDKWCPDCHHRLAFLRFVVKARELNGWDV